MKNTKYVVTAKDNTQVEISLSNTRKGAITSIGCANNKDWAELKKLGFNLVKIVNQ